MIPGYGSVRVSEIEPAGSVRQLLGVGAQHLVFRAAGEAELGGVGGGGGAAEARVGRRRLVERRPRDDAAELARSAAGRNVVEVAAPSPADFHQDVAARDERADEAPPHRRPVVDVVADEAADHARALRVADQGDAAAPVVVRQILVPRLDDVGKREVEGRVLVSADGDRGDRALPVDGRVDAAVLREALGLKRGNRVHLLVPGLVGVRPGVLGDRRVDVEAVDPAALRRHRLHDLVAAVGALDGRRQIADARVRLGSRLAQPLHLRASRRRRSEQKHSRQQPHEAGRDPRHGGDHCKAVVTRPTHLARRSG